MRFRSNGRLLGGLATLLALCGAGAGCQSSHHRPEAAAPRLAGRGAGAPIAVAGPAAPAVTPVAALYRPQAPAQSLVTRAAPERGSVIASTWQPVQHLSPQPGPDGGEAGNAVPAPGATPPGEMHVVARPNLEAPGRLPGGAPTIASTEPGPLVGAEPPFVGPAPSPHPAVEGGAVVLPPALDGHVLPPGAGPPPPHGVVVAPLHGLFHRGPGHPVAPPPVPREFAKRALSPYIVEPPDILLIQGTAAITLPTQPLAGQFLVRPDGSIGLGIYGSVFVAGMTLDQIANAVAAVLQRNFQQIPDPEAPKSDDDAKKRDEMKAARERVKEIKALTIEQIRMELQVDVLAYNSKFYYVITDGGGFGEQVYPIPITGNETVLDALSKINGLPPVASKKNIWVARATKDCHNPTILPVDWCGITQRGCAETNYQIFPGDRVYVKADCLIRTDSFLAKFLSPVQRVLGTVLLGSATVNSIKNSNPGGGTSR